MAVNVNNLFDINKLLTVTAIQFKLQAAISGAVVSKFDHQSTGPSSIPAVHPHKWVGG